MYVKNGINTKEAWDQRLLRATLTFEEKIEKKTLQMVNGTQPPKIFDETVLRACVASEDWSLKGSQETESCRKVRHSGNNKQRERKRHKVCFGSGGGRGTNTLEYSLPCKLIRRKLKEDLKPSDGEN
ncbi:unnamed protein product [Soboliphyme baturini]|uniref:KRAB domain-containing protein n=1 Tax=Soboliphyme baturini TaxID=241478 RepID=A0A183ITS9_9BILA|nr:unnamed protein product [Soboliphyme baturini]